MLPRSFAAGQGVREPPMAGLAALLVGVYLALHACFAPEFMLVTLGFSVPVVALLAALLPVVWLIVSPQPLRFLQTGIGITYIFVVVWWMASTLVMSFKGYLLEMLEYAIRFHTAPLVLCGLLVTHRRVRTTLLGYCSGFVFALLLCWKYGQMDAAGRFCIPGTSLGNPNDLALNLLFGAGYMSILVVNSSTGKRLLFAACGIVTLYFLLKTGSRANFITLCIVLLFVFKLASARVRVMLVVSGVLVGVLMVAAIPKHTWVRLTTFERASEEELAANHYLSGAIGSTEARKELQKRAIMVTLEHPVFGVGPRMFVYALNDFMKAEGFAKGTWQHAHNTYLDISAETGLVGLALYASCIVWCVRTNYRSVKATRSSPKLRGALAQSCSLMFASVVFAFGTLFCSITYVGQMPFLVGLTAANWLALCDAGAFAIPRRRAEFTFQRTLRKRSPMPETQHISG